MDEADSAEKYMELSMRASLAARAQVKPELQPRGSCYNCEEPLPQVEETLMEGGQPVIKDGKEVKILAHRKLFCDKDCSDDWEARKKRRV